MPRKALEKETRTLKDAALVARLALGQFRTTDEGQAADIAVLMADDAQPVNTTLENYATILSMAFQGGERSVIRPMLESAQRILRGEGSLLANMRALGLVDETKAFDLLVGVSQLLADLDDIECSAV